MHEVRIVYAASGTWLSAAIVEGSDALVAHGAYWAGAHDIGEARYVVAVVNSDTVLARVRDLQPHGERTKRHFDNLVWTLPIPTYNPAEPIHRQLAEAAMRAEQIAADVPLAEGHFTAKRRAIRAALVADGIAAEIERLVTALLA